MQKKNKVIQTPQLSQPAKISLTTIGGVVSVTCVTMLAIFLLSYLGTHVIDQQFFWFDNALFNIIIPLRNPLLSKIMFFITFLGSGTFLTIAAVCTIGYLYKNKRIQAAIVFIFLLLSGMELNFLLKNIFQRARPEFYPLVNEPSYSFPSGHAMNSFIFYTALAFFVLGKITNNWLRWMLVTVTTILILLIGFSRIYLGAHYPSDVAAGFLTGFLWFGVIVCFQKILQKVLSSKLS